MSGAIRSLFRRGCACNQGAPLRRYARTGGGDLMRWISLCMAGGMAALGNFNAHAQQAGKEQGQEILNQIKKRGTIKLSATTIQDAIHAAAYKLQRISPTNLAARINEDA